MFKKYFDFFENYVLNLPLEDSLKNVILNKDFINRNPEFYIYYPLFFAEGLDVNLDKLENLCIAGYLYYESSIFLDKILDDGFDKEKLFVSLICQEETIKILTDIFGKDSKFWKYWNQRRNEFIKATDLDKELFLEKEISNSKYFILADLKSTFGKAAIDSVYCLSSMKNKDSVYEKLLKSHSYFSIAFQINDDILDMQQDFDKNQFNYANYRMRILYPKENDITILKKKLYIEGESKNLYLEAINFIDKALNEIVGVDASLWRFHLIRTKKKFINTIIEIENYLEQINSKIKQSNIKPKDINIKNSINKAINYISVNQKQTGEWLEYVNQGGISDLWSTAFIISKIYKIEKLENECDKGIKYITKNIGKDFLWGYNKTWISDGDSTNFCILSLLLKRESISNTILEKWRDFRKESGAFSTYIDPGTLLESLEDKNITNVEGWCSEHQCVTSAAFYIQTLIKDNPIIIEEFKNYFHNIGIEKVTSYWWTNSIYTLYYLALSFDSIDAKEELNIVLENIFNKQNEDGSFSQLQDDRLFYTGKSIEALLFDYDKYKDSIELGINYLLNNQYEDGSWDNSHSLLIPNPSEFNVSNVSECSISTHGTNVRAKEFNRLFTTATILSALNKYEQRIVNTSIKQ